MAVNSVSSSDSANQLLKLNMMQQMIEQGFGDGMESQLVFQSVLDSMKTSADPNTKKLIQTLTSSNILNMIGSSNSAINGTDSTDSADSTGGTDSSSLLSSLLGGSSDTSSSDGLIAGGQSLESLSMQLNPSLGYLSSNAYSLGNILNNGASSVSTNSSDANMQQIYASVNKYAKQYGVDPNFVLAIIKNESDFQPNCVSSVGATGLMQLMPENFSTYGVSNPYDIDQNIKGGVALFKQNLNQYNGDYTLAYMAYGAGSGTMQRRGVTSASDLYKMPQETQVSVPRVLKYYKEFSGKTV